ncbi:MAG TPA: M20/M25/M40 family metallo-hydrolase [Sphingobium sp.]
MKRVAATLAIALAAASPALARLSGAEQTIVAAVDADQEHTIALLETWVAQNSGTRNIAGVTRVGEMVRPELEALGFEVRWIPMTAVQRAGHIVAIHKGKPGTMKMLLIGHLDTVFEPSSPFQTFERKGDKLHGPGASDDKGGVAVMIMALRAMQKAGTLKDANIEIVLTGDEESSGSPTSISRADLIAAGKRADVALDFEGLAVDEGVDHGSIARRSAGDYTITATGKTAHSSGIFSKDAGYGAVYELVRIIDAFRTQLPEPNLTFNIGLVGGGATTTLSPDDSAISATGKTNIIPPMAIARGDFRALSPEQVERVQAKMVAIVAQHLPGTDAKISFKEGYPPMAPTAGNRALLDRLNRVNDDLGLNPMPPLDPLKRGAGDISFVAADTDGLVGLGPSSDGDHTPDETVDLDSFPRQAKRAAILMTRLAGERSRKP